MPLLEGAVLYAVWNEFRRAVDPALTAGLAMLQDLLEAQGVGDPFVRSPALLVISQRTDDSFTLVARGRFDLFENVVTDAFLELELVCARRLRIIAIPLLPPIEVREWRVAAGEITLGQQGVWHATHGLVRTQFADTAGLPVVSWGGHGRLELEKLQFLVDAMLITDGAGFVIQASLELPMMIPLGSTGLGVNGLTGLIAVRYGPYMRDDSGVEVVRPDARDYVRWALAARHDSSLTAWRPVESPGAVTFGLGLHAGTLFDQGKVLRIRNAGFVLILPQGVLLFGGSGTFVDSAAMQFHAVVGYDAPSASLALGGLADLRYPETGDRLLTVEGPMEGFFSFRHPELFYLNVGTRDEPVRAVVEMSEATAYFQIDAHRTAFGAMLAPAIGWSLPARLVEVAAVLRVTFEAILGWNPFQVESLVTVEMELHLILLFGLLRAALTALASTLARAPRPTVVRVTLDVRVEITFAPPLVATWTWNPIPDDRSPPLLQSPLACGFAVDAAGVRQIVTGGVTAALPTSRRTWTVMRDAAEPAHPVVSIWPDAMLVLPFAERPWDETGLVMGPPPATLVRGGYQVMHRLQSIDITAEATGARMSGVTAVWAEEATGSTGRLLVLGDDPFAGAGWRDTAPPSPGDGGALVVQDFGVGETVSLAVRATHVFHDLLVDFPAGGQIWAGLVPSPATRVLRASRLLLRWPTVVSGSNGRVDRVIFAVVDDVAAAPTGLVIDARRSEVDADVIHPSAVHVAAGRLFEGGLRVWLITAEFPGPVAMVQIAATGNKLSLLLEHVGWHARPPTSARARRPPLPPGRYNFAMAGTTTGVPPVPPEDDRFPLPVPSPVTWGVSFGFTVGEPEALADYVYSWSLGDARVLGRETAPWNPTIRGIGFPWYRRYPIALRSRVPWLLDLWPGATLELRAVGQGWASAWAPLLPRTEAASTREQLHDARGRAWILANGGTLPYDLRLVAELPPVAGDGFARIEVRRTRAGAAPLLVHSMPSRRSRFDDFTAHVTPARGRLSAGFAPRPAGEPSSRVDVAEAGLVWAPGDPIETTRDGLPPPTWAFPPAIQANLAPIDESATARFVRLAHDGAVPGLFEPVAATDVQSLLDEAGHLVALWWRTPEPLDWRRLDAWIRVRGPTELPYVPTFTARLSIVPSPDGSGAFLIAMRGDHGVFIPRGRASVTLSYQMHVPGVVPLALPVLVGETTIVDLELPLGWALARTAGG